MSYFNSYSAPTQAENSPNVSFPLALKYVEALFEEQNNSSSSGQQKRDRKAIERYFQKRARCNNKSLAS